MISRNEYENANRNMAGANSNGMDIEEPMISTDRIVEEENDSPWMTFGPKKDDAYKGIFHITRSLYKEQQATCKALSSRKFFSKKLPITKKSKTNDMLADPANRTGNTYQSFIPNKVKQQGRSIKANFDIQLGYIYLRRSWIKNLQR